MSPATQIGGLQAHWRSLLPGHPRLGEELLRRWSEPHRHYHDLDHLARTLDALTVLRPADRAEPLAVWFHDAVHTQTPGEDERRSAELAAACLTDAGLRPTEIAEVVRLVLVTTDHTPGPEDLAGARVSDADLAILGADPETYLASVAALRRESHLNDAAWQAARLARLSALLASPGLFHTETGHARWSAAATANLTAEHRQLCGHSAVPKE